MKTNKFTRLLAVLLSVLMVASSLPLVANAGDTQTGTISQSESVLVCNKDPENRVNSTNGFNIVNDGAEGNISVGLWNYKLSSLKNISTATLEAKLNKTAAVNDNVSLSVKFYYLNPADLSSYITTNNGKNHTASFTTSGALSVSDIENEFGVSQSNFLYEVPHSTTNGTYTLNVAAAVNTAISNNWSGITFMAMQSIAHSGGTVNGIDNGWSDQWFTLGNINWSRTTVTLDEMKALLDEYQARISACTSTSLYTNMQNSFNAWMTAYRTYICVLSGTEDASVNLGTDYANLKTQMDAMQPWTTPKISAKNVDDFTPSQLVGGDETANVLYYQGIKGQNAVEGGVQIQKIFSTIHYAMFNVRYGDVVLLYDGTGDNVGFPISAATWRSGGSANAVCRSIRSTHDVMKLQRNWHGYLTSNGDGFYCNVAQNELSIVDNSAQPTSIYNDPACYSNTLYFTGDRQTFKNNVSDPYLLNYDMVNWLYYDWNGSSSSKDKKSKIYVINYAALLDVLANIDFSTLLTHSSEFVSNLLANVDQVTSYDPDKQITGEKLATEVQVMATKIATLTDNLTTQITNLENSYTYDIKGYVDAAKYYSSYKAIRDGNNADGKYVKRTYDRFALAYDSTTELFSDKYVKNSSIPLAHARHKICKCSYLRNSGT